MLKKIAIVLGLCLLLAAGAGYYWWRQVTALPDWYTDAQTIEADPSASGPSPSWVPVGDDAAEDDAPSVQPPVGETAPATKKPRKSSGERYEMRGFHRRGSTSSPVVKASRATLEEGRLEAGVVLDLSKLPTDKLSPRDRELHERALAGFPGLAKRDVYVGVEDDSVARGGVLTLGPDPMIRIGNLRYSLSSAAAKLGMTHEQLRTELDNELRRLAIEDSSPG